MEPEENTSAEPPEQRTAKSGCGLAIATLAFLIIGAIIYDLWPLLVVKHLTTQVISAVHIQPLIRRRIQLRPKSA